MKYNISRMFADGVERKRTLNELANEIEQDAPNAPVEIVSKKKGHVWTGHARNITADLRSDYLKGCVQGCSVDEYGVTILMR